MLEARLMDKLARADIIAEQRSSIAGELQRMRKDIAQQEAWVKVPAAPHARAFCTPKGSRASLHPRRGFAEHAQGHCTMGPRSRCCPPHSFTLSYPHVGRLELQGSSELCRTAASRLVVVRD